MDVELLLLRGFEIYQPCWKHCHIGNRKSSASTEFYKPRARALKMIDMVACLIARVTGFFLIDIVNKVQAFEIQVYESANCTNLQPVTLVSLRVSCDKLK